MKSFCPWSLTVGLSFRKCRNTSSNVSFFNSQKETENLIGIKIPFYSKTHFKKKNNTEPRTPNLEH